MPSNLYAPPGVADLSQVSTHPAPVYIFPQPAHPSVTSKVKRLIGILGAIVGPAITAVVAIPVAIMTQLDNPGPLFYSQTHSEIRCEGLL